jgi:ParB family chromosome partitioning protein
LLKLPKKVKERIQEGAISVGHAKAIMAIPDSETQIKVAEEVVRELLSVRETEERVAEIRKQAGRADGRARTGRGAREDPNVAAAGERLTRALVTKVRIVKKGERGRIEIQFYSDAELDRLYAFLLTAEKGH